MGGGIVDVIARWCLAGPPQYVDLSLSLRLLYYKKAGNGFILAMDYNY